MPWLKITLTRPCHGYNMLKQRHNYYAIQLNLYSIVVQIVRTNQSTILGNHWLLQVIFQPSYRSMSISYWVSISPSSFRSGPDAILLPTSNWRNILLCNTWVTLVSLAVSLADFEHQHIVLCVFCVFFGGSSRKTEIHSHRILWKWAVVRSKSLIQATWGILGRLGCLTVKHPQSRCLHHVHVYNGKTLLATIHGGRNARFGGGHQGPHSPVNHDCLFSKPIACTRKHVTCSLGGMGLASK